MIRHLILPALLLFACGCIGRSTTFNVNALIETVPVATEGDAADDPAIWVHPTDPARSLVIGTNKQRGLVVYTLDGAVVHENADGRVNNVDVRYDFPLGGRRVDIVATENRTDHSIAIYTIDESGRLVDVAADRFKPGNEVYGFGLYHSHLTGRYFAFVGSKDGLVFQIALADNGAGRVAMEVVRTLQFASQVEGIVADDERGVVYIGEEEHGVWMVAAEPDAPTEATLISAICRDCPLRRADVEGLALYKTGPETGYLLVSSQGSNEFAIFERGGAHAWLGTFSIVPGPAVDGAEETDGIEVTSIPLGERFPAGLFVAQDGHNDDGLQNFKFVSWADIAAASPVALATTTTWSPRRAD
jgi:3-phytase